MKKGKLSTMNVMLSIHNLSVIIKSNDRKIISELSFSLYENDKIAIIGEEGNGKSTLMKAIYDQNLISNYCFITGSINSYDNKIGFLPQLLTEEEKNQTIEEYILTNELGIVDYNLYQDIYSKQILFSDLNFDINMIPEQRLMSTLSGGERIKLGLIKLVLANPDIILLDEPTNDLDLNSLVFLENFINSTTTPILFISHDETLLENTANKIIHLELRNKKTLPISNVASMSYNDYIEKRLGMIQKDTQIARMQRREYQVQKDILNNQYNKVRHELETITRADPAGARLLKKKMKNIKSHEYRFEREKEEFTDVPDVEEALNFHFSEDIYVPTNKVILDLTLKELKIKNHILANNIELNINGPEHVVIIGINGVGKSTLIKHIHNILTKRDDLNIEYMPQLYSEMFDENQIAYKYVAQSNSAEDVSKARTLMGSLKFTSAEMTNQIKELSGGQKAKLFLLKIIIGNPDVIILDEPTRNLSPLSNPVIRNTLATYNGTIISVSHDRKYIKEVADTAYELTKNGLKELDITALSFNKNI